MKNVDSVVSVWYKVVNCIINPSTQKINLTTITTHKHTNRIAYIHIYKIPRKNIDNRINHTVINYKVVMQQCG